jgi:hypothetical protein
MSEDFPVYYRILVSADDPGKAVIVEMQEFDEVDYDHDRYVTKKRFSTMEELHEFCREVLRHTRVPVWQKLMVQSLLPLSVSVDPYMEES